MFAARTRAKLRGGELFARYDGEEFVMLLSHATCEDGRHVAERVRATTAASPVVFESPSIEANCVDGSVLLVSLLRKIGIDAFLVLEPGHCYTAFHVDKEWKHPLGIETTLLGETIDPADLEIPKLITKSVPQDLRDDYSFLTFAVAVLVGTGKLAEDKDKFQKERSRYRFVEIGAARKAGVLPLAFQKGEGFAAGNVARDSGVVRGD